jgi:hypothetical protein
LETNLHKENPKAKLEITGTAIFGGIEIKE